MPRIHKNIHVSGTVQGVGFRFSAYEKAKSLGLAGFVRNEPDGTVYIEVEGSPVSVEQFLEWCREGPFSADVREVRVEDGPPKNFDSFEIKNSGV